MLMALGAILCNGVLYDKDSDPFECSEPDANALIISGAAQIVQADDPLLSMTVAELKQLAVDRGVTLLDGITKKADIVAFLNTPEGHGNV